MINILCINLIITSLIITTTPRRIFSAIWLILAFLNAALILIILEIEFIASLIIIVYIGAIAILFLFTIMMLNLNTNHKIEDNSYMIPIGGLTIILLLIKITEPKSYKKPRRIINKEITVKNEDNIEIIRKILYSEYRPWFIIRRIILLTSMIAIITIIQKEENNSLKQQLWKQIQRNNKLYKQ